VPSNTKLELMGICSGEPAGILVSDAMTETDLDRALEAACPWVFANDVSVVGVDADLPDSG
jgi:hypothetical protein